MVLLINRLSVMIRLVIDIWCNGLLNRCISSIMVNIVRGSVEFIINVVCYFIMRNKIVNIISVE